MKKKRNKPCVVFNCPAIVSPPSLRYCPVHLKMLQQGRLIQVGRVLGGCAPVVPVTDRIEREGEKT